MLKFGSVSGVCVGRNYAVCFFFVVVVFISTCLVTVTPQCILFSEMVKKDSYIIVSAVY